MTPVGKPLYTRYGDENDVSPFLATLSAIIEKYKMYFFGGAKSVIQKFYH